MMPRSWWAARIDVVLLLALGWFCGCGDGGRTDGALPRGGEFAQIQPPQGVDAPPDWTVRLAQGIGEAVEGRTTLVLMPLGPSASRVEARRLRGTRGWFGAPLEDGRYQIQLETIEVRQLGGRSVVSLAVSRLEVVPSVVDVSSVAREPLSLAVRRRRGSGLVTAMVSTEDGKPVGGATVQVLQETDRRALEDIVAEIRTSPDGAGSVSGLLAGRYRVRLADAGQFGETERKEPDYRIERRSDFDLADGASRVVRLVVSAGGQIEGQVHGFDPATDGKLTVAARRLWPDGIWRPLGTSGLVLSGTKFSAQGLAPATYRVVVSAQGREVRAVVADVEAGRTSQLDVDVGPENPVRVALEYRAESRESPGAFNFNRADDPLAGDVALGTLAPGEKTSLDTPASPRPGRYLLVVWSRRIAMLCDVTKEPSQTIQVVPPEAVVPTGTRTLLVRVEGRTGSPLQRMFVGLKSAADEGAWLRFEETWPVASFAGLREGPYEILVFDGVFGVTAGLEPQPIRRRVEVGEQDREEVIRPFDR